MNMALQEKPKRAKGEEIFFDLSIVPIIYACTLPHAQCIIQRSSFFMLLQLDLLFSDLSYFSFVFLSNTTYSSFEKPVAVGCPLEVANLR